MSTPYPFTPGVPVDVEDIAAKVAQERGLGAGGANTYQSFIRVAELSAEVIANGSQIVRLTEDGLVDAVTGESLDDTYQRFWVMDIEPDQPRPYGEDTRGIVDEDQGGIVMYVHKDSVYTTLNTLRAHG